MARKILTGSITIPAAVNNGWGVFVNDTEPTAVAVKTVDTVVTKWLPCASLAHYMTGTFIPKLDYASCYGNPKHCQSADGGIGNVPAAPVKSFLLLAMRSKSYAVNGFGGLAVKQGLATAPAMKALCRALIEGESLPRNSDTIRKALIHLAVEYVAKLTGAGYAASDLPAPKRGDLSTFDRTFGIPKND